MVSSRDIGGTVGAGWDERREYGMGMWVVTGSVIFTGRWAHRPNSK